MVSFTAEPSQRKSFEHRCRAQEISGVRAGLQVSRDAESNTLRLSIGPIARSQNHRYLNHGRDDHTDVERKGDQDELEPDFYA